MGTQKYDATRYKLTQTHIYSYFDKLYLFPLKYYEKISFSEKYFILQGFAFSLCKKRKLQLKSYQIIVIIETCSWTPITFLRGGGDESEISLTVWKHQNLNGQF